MPHLQSNRFDPRTSLQNKHTILPFVKTHTMTKTSGRLHSLADSLLWLRSADCQIIRKTTLHRNSIEVHEERIPDLHILTIRELPPALGKTAMHWLHCIPHDFGLPMLCIHSRIAIGNPLKSSPDFPPLYTVHETFTSHGVPSITNVSYSFIGLPADTNPYITLLYPPIVDAFPLND